MSPDEAVDAISDIARKNQTKHIGWKITIGPHEMLTGVFGWEWLSWHKDKQLEFVHGLEQMFYRGSRE